MKTNKYLISTMALALAMSTAQVNADDTTIDSVTTTDNNDVSINLTSYTNEKLNVYANSRATKIYYDSVKNTLTIEGYAFVNGRNFDDASDLWREIILVNADNTSPEYAYREQVKSMMKGQFLTANKNINPNGDLDYDYAMYTVTLDLNKMKKYDNKTYEALKGGNYLIYIRCSDGKNGKLMPLQNVTLSDGTRMDLPEQFKSIDYTSSIGVVIGGERAVPELEKPLVQFVDNKLVGQKPIEPPVEEVPEKEEEKKPSGGGGGGLSSGGSSGGSGGGAGGGGGSSSGGSSGGSTVTPEVPDSGETPSEPTPSVPTSATITVGGSSITFAIDSSKNVTLNSSLENALFNEEEKNDFIATYILPTGYEFVVNGNGYRIQDTQAPSLTITGYGTNENDGTIYINVSGTDNKEITGYAISSVGTATHSDLAWQNTGNFLVDDYGTYFVYATDSSQNMDSKRVEVTASTYSINYVLDGGSVAANAPVAYVRGDDVQVINIVPTKAGFTFDRWYSDSALTIPATDISASDFGNKTYYAKFTPNTYNIQYVDTVNGSLEGSNPVTYTTGGENVTLLCPTKEGYKCIGWVYDGTLYHDIYAEMFEGLEDGSTITLNASWQVIDYEISYVNVDEHSNPTTYNVETEEFTLINPSKDWHNFLGWTTEGVETPTLTMVVDTSVIGNKEYVAHFEPVTFAINYEMDGGNTSSELITSYVYGSNKTINLETPTKETANGVYYEFNGYRLEDGELIYVITARDVTELADSNNQINITASWIPHSISSEEALADTTTAAKFALYGLEHYHYDTDSNGNFYWLPEAEPMNAVYGNELIDQFEYKSSAEILEYEEFVQQYVNAINGMALSTTQDKSLALADLIMNGNEGLGIEGIYYQADINANNYVTIEDVANTRSEQTGNRVTNCQGHARLFNAAARKLGIVSASVTGVAKSNGVAHMWNLIYDNGNYYEIDVVQVGIHTEYTGTAGYWSQDEQKALYNNDDYDYAKEFLQLLANSTIYDLN